VTVLVALSDTHGYPCQVPDGDVLVHAGDVTDDGSLADLARAADWLHALPHRHKVLVAGNHDACLRDCRDEALRLLGPIHYLEDAEVTLAGLRIWGSPWTPEFGGWPFMLPRGAALAAKWALIPQGLDVLVTHGPPHGILDEVWGRAEGCEELADRVAAAAPRLHVFGHIHEGHGTRWRGRTLFANVSTAGEHPATVFPWPPRRTRPR
jgi:predicted phosphodiesterase